MPFLIHAKLPQVFFQHAMHKQGFPCCGSLTQLSETHDSKVNLVDLFNAEKIDEAVLLYEFKVDFTASLFKLFVTE